MKRLLAWVLTLALCLTFAACSNEKEPYQPTGDGLTWEEGDGLTPTGIQEEPQQLSLTWYPEKTLNPYSCGDFTNQALLPLLYQGLFAMDRNYNLEPVLCQSYRISADMTTYTFYPAKATFSDGSALTAEDILVSLQTAKEGSVYGGRLSRVKTMELSEDGGVVVTMDTAYENLPILLDIPIVKSNSVLAEVPTGTGPYRMEGTGSGAILRRRTDWWCKASMAVTADTISLMVAESSTQIRDTFQFRNLSLVCANPASDHYADYRCDYELWDCENGDFLYLACNMNSKVFSQAPLRAALPGVLDRESIAEDNYRGFGRAATLPASPLSPYYNQTLASRYSYDGGAAMKQAVVDAQLPADTVVQLLVNSDDSLRARVARTIADALRDCGLTVELLNLGTSQYKEYLRNGWYDLYLGQTRLSPNMDLSAFFSRYGALNYGDLYSAELYELCIQSLANHGNFYTLHQTLLDDGRMCPILFSSYAIYATRGLLSELTPSRCNVFYYTLGRTMENALLKDE